jgi:O-antigen/teichoic acid export membrane protein
VSLLALIGFSVSLIVDGKIRVDIHLPMLGSVLLASILTSIGVQRRAILRRRLYFFPIAAGEGFAALIGFCVAAFFAYYGQAELALCANIIAQSLVILLFLLVYQRLPSAHHLFRSASCSHERRLAMSVVKFFSNTVLEVIHQQVTTLGVGLLGPQSLGLYSRLSLVVQLPVQILTATMNRVLASGFVNIADQFEASRALLKRSIRLSFAIVAPICAGIAGSATLFVVVLLGDQWSSGSRLIPYVALAALAYLAGQLIAVFNEANLWLRTKFWVQAVCTTLLMIGLFLVIREGLEAAVMLIAAIWCLYWALNVSVLFTKRYFSLRDVADVYMPGAFVGLLIFGCTHWMGSAFIDVQNYLVFICQIVASGLIALICYLILFKDLSADLIRSILPPDLSVRLLRVLGYANAN